MTDFVIDAFEFARQKERREGHVAVADLPRLSKESTGAFGQLKWTLTGSSDRLGNPQLTLSVAASVKPVCQRCLQAFELNVESESVLVLAKDDADADRIEKMLDDDDIDVIVGAREMNLLDMIEDEALLALPLSPRHESCPQAAVPEAPKAVKPSPFAVLKDLKK